MSDTATLAERLRVGLVAVAAFVRGNTDHVYRVQEAINAVEEAVARIAELEAAAEDGKLFVYLHALAIEHGYMPDPGESAYDLLQRAIMTNSPRSRARTAP